MSSDQDQVAEESTESSSVAGEQEQVEAAENAASPSVEKTSSPTPKPPEPEKTMTSEEVADEALSRASIAIGSQRKKPEPAEDEAAEAPPVEAPKPKPDPTALGEPIAEPQEDISAPTSKVPTPSVREELSSELEAEYQEALASGDLDNLMLGGAQAADTSSKEVEPGARVRSKVVAVHRESVFFDLGARHQGMASLKQFNAPPEVGAKFEVLVGDFNEEDGLYVVTIPGSAIDKADWSSLAEGVVVDAVVTGHNKGGLECEVSNIRGFIPMSQISMNRVENCEEFVGQKMACVVTEVKPEKKNLVLSRRAMLEREAAEKKEKLMASLAPGQLHQGVVRTIKPYGAFVDIGGVDGLLHIGQMSWDRINHPSDLLKEGEAIQVKIIKIDEDTGKLSFSYRETAENPWTNVQEKYPVQSKVKGTVSRIADFGGFVKLEPGVEGLVHISELSHQRVIRTSDVLSEGQEVEALVVSVDPEKQRIGLSLKALEAKAQPAKVEEEEIPEPTPEELEKKRKKEANLKGGLGSGSGGEQFGLKW
ncbi:MAG: S1 RNA-binding domain-containing protein [Pirellulales bacterium]|nr:S1 RNA-binding domain-containing protein [Pirellulales bacterium]